MSKSPASNSESANAAVTPLNGIDAVFVLTVRSFSERIRHIQAELGRFDIPFQFVFAHDIKEISDAERAHFVTGALGDPHQSLVLKHIAVWRAMREHDLGRVLVLEDDALLVEKFPEQLNSLCESINTLAPGWLIYLGGATARLSTEFMCHSGPLVPCRMREAEGYITDQLAAKRRLTWLESNLIDRPADALLKQMDIDMDVEHYWPKDYLVEQGSIDGRFATVLDGPRARHSRLYLRLRYYWDRYRRRRLYPCLFQLKEQLRKKPK